MADGITLQLKGNRELVAALRELRDQLPKNVIRAALRSSADRMRKVIITFAPRRTGALVNAIGIKTSSSGGVARARVTINTAGKRGDPENAFYWRFLELGFHDRAGIPHRFQFIQPAFETEANDAAQNVIDALEKAIAKAESRGRS
jgi:HK97 gp10 family phage protein